MPTIRTVWPAAAAARTAAATSAVVRGLVARRGVARWLPAQLRQECVLPGDM
nr:hypothetical protein GCM10010200_012410 [Actinomadura rugatobispora]